MTEYQIIRKNSFVDLEREVNEYLRAGWKLAGGVAVSTGLNGNGFVIDYILQAITKEI